MDADLNVMLNLKLNDGTMVSISTKCDSWANVAKFINDFKANILPKNNGRR